MDELILLDATGAEEETLLAELIGNELALLLELELITDEAELEIDGL